MSERRGNTHTRKSKHARGSCVKQFQVWAKLTASNGRGRSCISLLLTRFHIPRLPCIMFQRRDSFSGYDLVLYLNRDSFCPLHHHNRLPCTTTHPWPSPPTLLHPSTVATARDENVLINGTLFCRADPLLQNNSPF